MDVTDKNFVPYRNPELPYAVLPVCPIEKKLKGQKALVTGASSGIGKGIAIGLGRRCCGQLRQG